MSTIGNLPCVGLDTAISRKFHARCLLGAPFSRTRGVWAEPPAAMGVQYRQPAPDRLIHSKEANMASPWRIVATVPLLAATLNAQQPSTLDVADAREFIGTWVIAMQEPPGAQETVRVWDRGGKVAASVQAQRFPPLDVPDIRKVGDNLVLTVQRFENGKPVRAVVTLAVKGDTLSLRQELEGSPILKHGAGKRQLVDNVR